MRTFLYLFIMVTALTSCEDFVKIDPPRTSLVTKTVFESDVTAEAAVVDLYYQLRTSTFASGSFNSVGFLMSLASDEQVSYYNIGSATQNAEFTQFNENELAANNTLVLGVWADIYNTIYRCNAVLEGVAASTGISASKQAQLEAEAKVIRAFCNFYLVNLWGDVPLVTTTDYRANSNIGRSPEADVYQQMVADLTDAEALLGEDYSTGAGERVRVNKYAAAALLARVYLYMGEWSNAAAQASLVIDNSLYALVANLNEVSIKNNSEAIWQLWSDQYPNELFTYYIFYEPFYGAVRPEFVAAFDPTDSRLAYWVGSSTPDVVTYYFSMKYSSFDQAAEYSTLMRLGEQYLIRAEARAHLNDVSGAQADINMIRHRADLADTPASDQPSLLAAIEDERRSELFNEWGHRWFDLKRTGRADEVLSSIKSGWKPTALLLPLPATEVQNNQELTGKQNPGY